MDSLKSFNKSIAVIQFDSTEAYCIKTLPFVESSHSNTLQKDKSNEMH